VEVNGVTGPGDYAPVVLAAQLQISGKRRLPDPIRTAVDHLKTGREDSQRVEIEAFVRSCRVADGSTTLKFASGGEHFSGNIPYLTNAAAGEQLIDTKVRVTGICGTVFDERRQLKGIKLYIPDISQIRVEEASPTNPFSLPVKPIASIVQFNPYRVPGHRVRVQGIVTLRRSAALFLRDDTQGLFVRAEQLPEVAPGDWVDVAGFQEFNPFAPQLDDAIVRTIRSGQPPLPMRVTAASLRDGTFDAELVQMEARVLDVRSSKSNDLFILEGDGDIFKAYLEGRNPSRRISDLQVGSRVLLTGVCSIQENSVREPVGFRLLLRSPHDVILLAKPSWWTPTRIQQTLALIAVLALGGLSWLIMLHSRVRLQNRIIGERLESETALEQRYRDIFENANDVIYTHDPGGNLTSLNRVGERLLGYTREEAIGLNLRQLVAPEHLVEAERITERELAGEDLPAHALDVITKRRQRVTLEVNSRPIFKDGVVVGIQGIARDITERRRAEQALRDSEERYRGLFDLNPLPMWIYDTETFAFLAVNCAAVEHYGYSTEEFLKLKLDDIRPGGQMPRMAGGGSQADTGFGGAAIWKHRKKDGTFVYVEVVSSPTNFAGRDARLILINDVTERQRLEDHVRQLQKMESVGQLAAGVAHDFNNLLTVIRGHADMMTLHGVNDPAIREPLREISVATDRAANLTRQLLMFSRKQVMQPRSVNLAEIVRNLGRLLRRTLGEHIELHLTGVPDLPPVLADTGMMEQVITNLAVNARDAMPRGGHLVIATGVVTLDHHDAGKNREARTGRFVCLTVTDTGCGMDTTTISRIFEPFFTTKEVGKGTGLGLATVYGIVKQHQGWIEVASRPGNGSAFKVFLPVCRQVTSSPALDQPSAAFPRGSETILLVEDEAPLRELSCQVLERLGYAVLSAASGVKALALWQDHKREIDLVVTDMVMPEGVSGRDLGEKVKADRPEMKILFVSGYNVELVGDNFVLREGLNFLPKPYNPQALLQAVRKCLDSGPKRELVAAHVPHDAQTPGAVSEPSAA
jgi:PAS domain S-box-containing protein